MKSLLKAVLDNEAWLMERVRDYALDQGYARYTSTLVSAWKISIAGLSEALAQAMGQGPQSLDFGPDDTFQADPAARFAIREAQLHRERGVSLSMFLGLLKYYRQAYLDLARREIAPAHRRKAADIVARFFDRVEIGIVLEWSACERDTLLQELQVANRNLTNEKNKYLTVFESLALPAFLFDTGGRLLQANHAATQWLRLSTPPGLEYYLEKSGALDADAAKIDISASEILPGIAADILDFCGKPPGGMQVERAIRLADEERHYIVSMGKMLDFSNKFTGVVVSLEDITARRALERALLDEQDRLSETVRRRMKQLEKANRRLEQEIKQRETLEVALRQGAQFYRAVVEDQTEMVCRFTPDCVLTFANRAYCAFFGHARDEVVGKSFLPLIPEENRAAFLDHLRAITPQSPVRVVELQAVGADGEVRWQLWTDRGFFDPAGDIVEHQSVGSDITDRRRAEEELQRLNAELEQRVAERTRVAEEKASRLEQEIAQRKTAEERLARAYNLAAAKSRISDAFLNSPGEEMYSAVLKVLLEATGSEYGVFAYLDEEGAVVAPSLTRDVWEQCRIPDKTFRFPRETWGDSLWARAIREKRLLVKNGPGRVPEGHVPVHCAMAAPILFQDEVIGYLHLANRPDRYGGAEEDLMEEACRHIAPLLSARLRQERANAERRQAEKALRESQAILRQVLDSVPQSIFWKDVNSVYLGCNQVFARACGLSDPEQIVGKTDFDLPWPRAEAEAYRADDAEVVAGKAAKLHILEPFQQADGVRFWVDTSKLPLLDARQEVCGVLGVFEDVTEKKQAEEALRESEERHRTLFESMAEGACILDTVRDAAGAVTDYRIVGVNPAYSAILNVPRERTVGALVRELYGLSRPPDLEAYSRVLETGEPASFESILPELGMHFQVSAFRLGPDRFVAMFQDITQRKRAVDALRRRLEMEQVLAGVSGQLIGMRFEEIEKNLPPLLGIVAEAIGADRGRVCVFDAEGATCLSAWSVEGAPAEAGICPGPGGDAHAWVMSRLSAFESLVVSRLQDLPAEAAAVRASLEEQGIRSLLAVPLARGETLLGCLGFAALRAQRDWSWEDVSLIETFARTLASAIEAARLERALRHNERRYFDLIDNLSEGLWSVDMDKRTTFVNKSMAAMLGRTPGEILDEDPRKFMTAEGARVFDQRQKERAQGKSVKFSFEFLHRDGRRVFVRISAAPVRDEQGNVVGSMALVSDLSKERLLQLQLMQAQRLESIGQLAAGIAHEINTPTQYVDNNAQFLRGGFEDLLALLREYDALLRKAREVPALAEAVQRVEAAREERQADSLLAEIPGAFDDVGDGLKRIALIVDSVKRFAHPGRAEMAPADLNEALRSTIVVARNEWKYVAEVAADLDPGLPPVPCVLSDINQVALNLIVNAAHAIAAAPGRDPEAKGSITVRTRTEDNWAVIEVQDTGSGIPAAIRSRVFDPFFTTKEVGQGTGQGLAIAHTVVVEKHQGSISFATEEGRGTTFFVRLPLKQPPGNPAR